MRVVVCDDNKVYADEIKRNIDVFLSEKKIEFSIDTYYDSSELFNSGNSYDIAFLDVEMKPYSGIQVGKILKGINPYIIIFIITSYNCYLDDAMDLNVFRYIQKPLDVMRLKVGLEKALEIIDNTEIQFYLKNDKSLVSVKSNDIIFVETTGRCTKIVTRDCEYLSESKMKFWSETLIASFFYRVHKSFIINLKYVTEYKRDTVVLSKKYMVPIAFRTQSDFKRYFMNYIGGR